MITEYIDEALRRARYELIDDPEEPYYGEIPDLTGVWAQGGSLEGCRQNLKDSVESWIILSIKRSLPMPPLGPVEIREVAEAA